MKILPCQSAFHSSSYRKPLYTKRSTLHFSVKQIFLLHYNYIFILIIPPIENPRNLQTSIPTPIVISVQAMILITRNALTAPSIVNSLFNIFHKLFISKRLPFSLNLLSISFADSSIRRLC